MAKNDVFYIYNLLLFLPVGTLNVSWGGLKSDGEVYVFLPRLHGSCAHFQYGLDAELLGLFYNTAYTKHKCVEQFQHNLRARMELTDFDCMCNNAAGGAYGT